MSDEEEEMVLLRRDCPPADSPAGSFSAALAIALAATAFLVALLAGTSYAGDPEPRVERPTVLAASGPSGTALWPSDRIVPQSSIYPTTTFEMPAPGTVYTTAGAVVVVSGTARQLDGGSDNHIAAVALTVTHSGSFISVVMTSATLISPGQPSTTWLYSWTVPPPAGSRVTATFEARAVMSADVGPTTAPEYFTQALPSMLQLFVDPVLVYVPLAVPPGVPLQPPTPTPTPTPVVQNGDFKSGLTGWSATNGGLGLPQAVGRFGDNVLSALLGNPLWPCSGGVPRDSYSQIAQKIQLPDVAGAKLKFQWTMRTRDVKETFVTKRLGDSLDVYLVAAAGDTAPTTIAEVDRLDSLGRVPAKDTYTCAESEVTVPSPFPGQASYDVPAAKRGQQVWIVFRVWNRIDSDLNTYAYVTNVAVDIPATASVSSRVDSTGVRGPGW